MYCKKCNDSGFVLGSDRKKEPCSCLRDRVFESYAPSYYKSFKSLSKSDIDRLRGLDIFHPRVFIHSLKGEDIFLDSVKFVWLYKFGCLEFKELNIFEIMDMNFSKHPVYKSIFEITVPSIILVETGYEFEISRKEDFILQFLDYVRKRNVLYICTSSFVNSVLKGYFISSDYRMVDLSSSSQKREII